ncbi:MAG TPA: HTTM domain-containing protein, partial [Acidimicrobiales bacterium]
MIAALDRWFLAPVPSERIAALRILVGLFGTVYVLVRVPYILDVAALPDARFEPVGVVRVLDEPLPMWSVQALLAVTAVLALTFTVGWLHRITGPAYAIALLATLSYSNSWQHVAHTENLLVLHTAALAIAPATLVWSLDARRAQRQAPRQHSVSGWTVQLMSIITVLTYVVAGVAKVRHGGIDWVTGDVLRNLVAHDNLRKIVLGDAHSPIGGALVAHGWVFPPMAFAALLVELGAPLALLGLRASRVWIVAAWLFHAGVLAVMAILFVYPLTGIAFASMLRPEALLRWMGAKVRRAASDEPLVTAYRPPHAG